MYVGLYSRSLQLLINIQLCSQRSPMWRALQIIGEARVLRRLHEGRPKRLNFRSISHNYRVRNTTLKTNICALHLHICAARYDSTQWVFFHVDTFRQPCALRNIQLLSGKTFNCPETCSIPRHVSYSTSLGWLLTYVFSAASRSTSLILVILGFAQ